MRYKLRTLLLLLAVLPPLAGVVVPPLLQRLAKQPLPAPAPAPAPAEPAAYFAVYQIGTTDGNFTYQLLATKLAWTPNVTLRWIPQVDTSQFWLRLRFTRPLSKSSPPCRQALRRPT